MAEDTIESVQTTLQHDASQAPSPGAMAEVQRYLERLYPDPPLDAWLVISSLVSQDHFRSQWFTIAQADDAARYIVAQAQRYNVYVGLGLRHPNCTAEPGTRGESKDVYALGGLWIEFDHNAGVHAAQHLPTPDELLAFIEALPCRFSLLVDSGGGYHAYMLFKEMWLLDTAEEHHQAALLLRRFQRTIQARAAEHGWKVDGTADLARVLRPVGTLNHKSGTPQPVTLLHADATRSNPSDIADAPWLATLDDTYTPPPGHRDFPPTRLAPIVTGCAWLRHCRDEAARLPEPAWYGMLGIVGRCEDGEQVAHEWSAPYPRYSKAETARKLQHALADAGPRTCSTIRFDLGADTYCRDCQHWGTIKSPIMLGMPTRRSNGSTPGPAPTHKPVIEITTAITAVVDATQQAIRALPDGPHLFQRARQLALIARGVTPPKWLRRPPETPVIVPAEPAYLRELATQAATWEKYDKRSKRWEPALPPPWVIETLCARPSWPFPPLEGIVCAPTLRPDGTLLTRQGYDPETGLYLDLTGTDYPSIQAQPTLDDARTAIGKLQQVFIDFPFAASHHCSSAFAAVLSLVARYAIQGNVPLYAVRSTTRGSGKGLLIDAISVLATGRHAPRWAHTQDEEEERKRLLTLALAGDSTIHIDNVTRPLGSAPLDLALTAQTFSDRLLGKQVSREAPLHAVFFASGNNMAFHGDMARRVVPIDLDPKMERPEERDNFTHSPLLPWVLQERPTLVASGLTILKAYFAVGCPAQGIKPLGSFEAWSTLVRQALIWAGEADPCEGRQDIEAESDPKFDAFRELLTCWYACYSTTPQTLKRVVQDAIAFGATTGPRNAYDDLRDALGAFDPKYDGESLRSDALSYTLRAWKGRVIEDKCLTRRGKGRQGAEWGIHLLV